MYIILMLSGLFGSCGFFVFLIPSPPKSRKEEPLMQDKEEYIAAIEKRLAQAGQDQLRIVLLFAARLIDAKEPS